MTMLSNISQSELYIAHPKAEEIRLQKVQKHIADKISWIDLSFGKAYRNQQQDGKYVPEVYIGDNEYIPLPPDDSLNFSFLDVAQVGTYEEGLLSNLPVNIVFAVDLQRIYPSLNNRAEIEVREEVTRILYEIPNWLTITGWKEGVRNVFDSYNFSIQEFLVDMQPKYVFSIQANIIFESNKTC